MADLRTTSINGKEVRYLDKNKNGKYDKGEETINSIISKELQKPETIAEIDSLTKKAIPSVFKELQKPENRAALDSVVNKSFENP